MYAGTFTDSFGSLLQATKRSHDRRVEPRVPPPSVVEFGVLTHGGRDGQPLLECRQSYFLLLLDGLERNSKRGLLTIEDHHLCAT